MKSYKLNSVLLLLGIMGGFINASPPSDINLISHKSSLEVYDLQEIAVNIPEWKSSDLNPYDPRQVKVKGVFTSPSGNKYEIPGFYFQEYASEEGGKMKCDYAYSTQIDEVRKVGASAFEGEELVKQDDGEWRVRFRPKEVGDWMFTLKARVVNYVNGVPESYQPYEISREFHVEEKTGPENSGYIGLRETNDENVGRFLKFKNNNNSLFLIGENMVSDRSGWLNQHAKTRVKNWPNYFRYPFNSTGIKYDLGEGRKRGIGGICNYKKKIDELKRNGGNFFRFEINSSAHPDDLGHFLYVDPEQNQVLPNKKGGISYNQANAWRYDRIFQYAAANDINIKINPLPTAIFSKNWTRTNPWYSGKDAPWRSNGFNLRTQFYTNPCQFFQTNTEAFRELKHMFRYLIARYGHYQNIVSWEIIDELDHLDDGAINKDNTTLCIKYQNGKPSSVKNNRRMYRWFKNLSKYIKRVDNDRHLVSPGAFKSAFYISYKGKNQAFIDVANLNSIDFLELNEPYFEICGDRDFLRNFKSGKCKTTENYKQSGDPVVKFWKQDKQRLNKSATKTKFFEGPLELMNHFNKAVLVNSFWLEVQDYSRNLNEIDARGVYQHNALWRSLFSGSIGTAARFYGSAIHPQYGMKNALWNGTDKFDYRGVDYNKDLHWNSTKVEFTEGAIEQFNGVSDFVKKVDFTNQLKPLKLGDTDLSVGEIDYQWYRPNGRTKIKRYFYNSLSSHQVFGYKENTSKGKKYYGYIQKKDFIFSTLASGQSDRGREYLAGEKFHNISTDPVILKIESDANNYKIEYFSTETGKKVASRTICQSDYSSLINSNSNHFPGTPELNKKYGDIAFIATPNPKPTLKINNKAEIGKVCPTTDLKLKGSKIFKCNSGKYHITIMEVGSKYGDQTGFSIGKWFDKSKKSLNNFDLEDFCQNNGKSLKKGQWYKVKLSTGNPWQSNPMWFYVKNSNDAPQIKINNQAKIDKVCVNSSITLQGSINPCGRSDYYVKVMEADSKFGSQTGFSISQWFKNHNEPLDDFNIKGFCKNQGKTLKENQWYKVKLATGNPWKAVANWIYIESDEPDFKIKNSSGNWQRSSGSPIYVNPCPGDPVKINPIFSDCESQFFVSVTECNRWQNTKNGEQQWSKWYDHPANSILDLQKEIEDHGGNFQLRSGTLPNSSQKRYYKVKVATSRQNWQSKAYTIRKRQVSCKKSSAKQVTFHNNNSLNFSFNAYPNPYTSNVSFHLKTTEKAQVTLKILDTKGKIVQTLVDEELITSGGHKFNFKAPIAPGVYWARVKVGDEIRRQRIVKVQ